MAVQTLQHMVVMSTSVCDQSVRTTCNKVNETILLTQLNKIFSAKTLGAAYSKLVARYEEFNGRFKEGVELIYICRWCVVKQAQCEALMRLFTLLRLSRG